MTNRILLFVFLTTFFLFSRPLWAQSQGSGHYVIEQRYVRNLEWIGDNYTLKYEVVIEQSDGGGYKAYIREFTEKQSLQVSLPVGKYRYRIIPYDYLEQPGTATDWIYIEIKPAPIIPVETRKEDDESYVLHPDDAEKGAYVLQPDEAEEGYVFHHVEDEQKGNETVVKNQNDTVTVNGDETEKPINLYINAAWTPSIPLYGRMSGIYGKKFYAVGASVRFGVLFNKPRWFSPGIELLMSWYALNKTQDGDKISVQTGVTGINIVAQKKLPNPRMAVTLRAGFALVFQVGEINVEDYSYSTGGLIPQINIEASFLWFAYKKLYLEAGMGFTHLFDKNNNSGCLRPWIGVGWKF